MLGIATFSLTQSVAVCKGKTLVAAVLLTNKNLVVVTTTQVPRARCYPNKRFQEDLKPGGLLQGRPWAIRPIPVSSRILSSPHCKVRQTRHGLQCRFDDVILPKLPRQTNYSLGQFSSKCQSKTNYYSSTLKDVENKVVLFLHFKLN